MGFLVAGLICIQKENLLFFQIKYRQPQPNLFKPQHYFLTTTLSQTIKAGQNINLDANKEVTIEAGKVIEL